MIRSILGLFLKKILIPREKLYSNGGGLSQILTWSRVYPKRQHANKRERATVRIRPSRIVLRLGGGGGGLVKTRSRESRDCQTWFFYPRQQIHVSIFKRFGLNQMTFIVYEVILSLYRCLFTISCRKLYPDQMKQEKIKPFLESTRIEDDEVKISVENDFKGHLEEFEVQWFW